MTDEVDSRFVQPTPMTVESVDTEIKPEPIPGALVSVGDPATTRDGGSGTVTGFLSSDSGWLISLVGDEGIKTSVPFGDLIPSDSPVVEHSSSLVEAVARRALAEFKFIQGPDGKFLGSEPDGEKETKTAFGSPVVSVSQVVDTQLRAGMGKDAYLHDALDKPVLNPTPRNVVLQGHIDNVMSQIDAIHGMPEDTQSVTIHALSGNAAADGNFYYSGIYNPDTPCSIDFRVGDQPETSLTHEIGHYLDYADLGTETGFGSGFVEIVDGQAQITGASEFMAPVMDAIAASPEGQELLQIRADLETTGRAPFGDVLLDRSVLPTLQYLTDPMEMWARAYAQYVVTESGSESGLAEVAQTAGSAAEGTIAYQWSSEGFEPVREAITTSLSAAGLLH